MSGTPEARFPPMCTIDLSIDEAAAVFNDLGRCAEIESVNVKGGAEKVTDDTPYTLAEALNLLRAGAVRGVQVRYRFEEASWCDTFVMLSHGLRLVRVRHEFGQETSAQQC